MKFNGCPLRNELKEGLLRYERDNNVSPHSIVEDLIEEFLYKNKYLVIGAGDEEVPFPSELNKPHIKHAEIRANGRVQIRKTLNGTKYHYGTCNYEDAVMFIDFLKSKGWDVKYSTSQTKLKRQKQLDFLLNEIKKEQKQ